MAEHVGGKPEGWRHTVVDPVCQFELITIPSGEIRFRGWRLNEEVFDLVFKDAGTEVFFPPELVDGTRDVDVLEGRG